MNQLSQAEQGRLNAFELARYKKDWKAFKAKQAEEAFRVANSEEVVVEVSEPVVFMEPKAKVEVARDAVIEVCVTLPNKKIEFTLRKRDVMANVSQARMTESEFRNGIIHGLAPIMGRLE